MLDTTDIRKIISLKTKFSGTNKLDNEIKNVIEFKETKIFNELFKIINQKFVQNKN